MLIGISGKMNTGKDTIGRIIQYLTCPAMGIQIEMKDWINKPDYNNFRPDWQIVKFADALKDIVCILTGCTRKQLEDIDFKNSKLPAEWEYWYNYHYKLTTNDKRGILGKRYGSKAEVEKEYESISNNISGHSFTYDNYTYRELLQYLGTDLLRNQLHEDVWINALMVKYKPKICSGSTHCALAGKPEVSCNLCPEYPNWIITDVRFPNEAKAIKDRGGIIIRTNRLYSGQVTPVGDKIELGTVSLQAVEIDHSKPHLSETALDDYPFDYVIDNNGTLENLTDMVKDILIRHGIL